MVAATEGVVGKLRIQPGHQVVVVANAPPGRSLVIPVTGEGDPQHADVVIGFVTHPADLGSLSPVYAAALDGRLAWIGYRCGSDLSGDLITRAVSGYGVAATDRVALGDAWSAILLRAASAPAPSGRFGAPTRPKSRTASPRHWLRLAHDPLTEAT